MAIDKNVVEKFSKIFQTKDEVKTKVKETIASNITNIFEQNFDTRKYIENKLKIHLYENQLDVFEALTNPAIPYVVIVMARGGGKTYSVAAGLVGLCDTFSGLPIGVFGPKQTQAKNILNEVDRIRVSSNYVNSIIEQHSSERIKFKNGSVIQTFSAAEQAEIEGYHGILIMEEASLISNFTVSNRILPMAAWPGFTKVVKLGLPKGKNHFYESYKSQMYLKIFKDFRQCPILTETGFITIEENGKQFRFPKIVFDRMPLSLKKQMFSTRPDLWIEGDMNEDDFKTEYLLEWLENVARELSEEQFKRLFSGTYYPEAFGVGGCSYYFGLDLAGSSDVMGENPDYSSLTIVRVTETNQKQIVFKMLWQGDAVVQKEEINALINPRTGRFKCFYGCADRGFNASLLDELRHMGNGVVGITYQSREADSGKNFKNAMFDHFKWEIDNGRVNYPVMSFVDRNRYFKEAYIQWQTLEYELKSGYINRKISAPDEEGMFDDSCNSDVLAIWASDKVDPRKAPRRRPMPKPVTGPKLFY